MRPTSHTVVRLMTDTRIVHIVDDDETIRFALSSLLRSVGYEVRLYASAPEFLEGGFEQDANQCLILDVRLPGTGGLELQGHLRRISSNLPIILVTGHADVRMSVAGMKAGAIDFLEKPFRDQDLLDAVTSAFTLKSGRRNGPILTDLRQRYDRLSPRERQVIQLVASGQLNKQIAASLAVSEVTVKIHRSAGMRKMGATSLAEFARMAEILGIEKIDGHHGRNKP